MKVYMLVPLAEAGYSSTPHDIMVFESEHDATQMAQYRWGIHWQGYHAIVVERPVWRDGEPLV